MKEDKLFKLKREDLERRAKHCTTHHFACDCRELHHMNQLSQQAQEIELLRVFLEAWTEYALALQRQCGHWTLYRSEAGDELPIVTETRVRLTDLGEI